MHLKKIQLSGFKSFADKLTLPIDSGITGIVGPNGSGKSNIIDAARWVMGEQNAKNLRGKVATDIIFSGSSSRKALGMAEVSLIFDNSSESSFCPPEYRHEQEISLTRRLYVDGQREYLINKKPCRLKDIIHFFTSSGLGGRSYSMIQQGQVDRILNAKPEEVRVIIEEAAGTLVYKNRRDDALKKLDKTRENLSRVEDIVTELDRQKDGLQQQMENAKAWKEYSDELKHTELELFGREFYRIKEKLTQLESEINEQLQIEAEVLAEISTREAKQTETQNALDVADPGLEGLREEVSLVRERIVRAEGIISTADDRIEQYEQQLQHNQEDLNHDQKNMESLEAGFIKQDQLRSETKTRIEELRDLVETFNDQLEDVDSKADEYKAKISDFNEELQQYERMLESNTIRCEAIGRERDKFKADSSKEEERLITLNEELAVVKKVLSEVEEKASQYQSGLDEKIAEKNELRSSIEEKTNSIDQALSKRDELKEEYLKTRARHESLVELFEQNKVLESETLKDINCIGVMADFVRFGEKAEELSTYAKSAFERFTERVLVESLDDLNDLVKIAHEQKLKPFIVSVLENKNIEGLNSWCEKWDGIPFSEFLDINGAPEVLQKFISKIVYLPTLRLEGSEIQELPDGAVLFSSQGLVSMTSDEVLVAGIDSGLLSQRQDIDELHRNIEQLQGSLAKEQSQIDAVNLLVNQDKQRLSEIDEFLGSQSEDVLAVTRELEAAKQSAEHKTEQRDICQARIEGYVEDDRRLIAELSGLQETRITYDEEQVQVRSELETIQNDFENIDETRSEVFKIHEARKIELATLEEREKSVDASHAQLKEQIERLQSTLSRRYEEKTRLDDEIETIKSDLESSRGEIGSLLTRREELETDLTQKRGENAALIDQLRALDKELKTFRDKQAKCEKAINTRRIEMERLEIGSAGFEQQAMEKYHVELASYKVEENEEFDATKSQRLATRLRNKIEGLGAINMMAIEEYDQLLERYQFITCQRAEVFNSINLLEDALEEIEETTERKFRETYVQVDEEFSKLFPILFPGGEARLELTDPDDMLNAGIEIFARLPGKKFQRMTLLSGGEKALTAISLIFALLKTKPTPFCFLDEVDAPLDEANVGRYNKVLEALSERFQFIVITHNRRTMEVLDTLYGVTMQEPGVSKVVGVDMKKDIPNHLKKAFKEEPKTQPPRSGASTVPKEQAPTG